MLNFFDWIKIKEQLVPDFDYGDIAGRGDVRLGKAGKGDDKNLPMNMRSSPISSAMPTGSLPKNYGDAGKLTQESEKV